MSALNNEVDKFKELNIDKFKDIQESLEIQQDLRDTPGTFHSKKVKEESDKMSKQGELATIKKAGEKEFLTPQQFKERARELKRCKKDILYFCRNYFKIVSLKDGLVTLNPYAKQAELLEFIKNNNRVITVASRQVGKCQSFWTRIRIRNKRIPWFKISIPIGILYLIAKTCRWFEKLV